MFAAVSCSHHLMTLSDSATATHTHHAPLQRAATPAIQQRGLNRVAAALPQSSGCGCGVARDAVRQTVRRFDVAAAGRCQGCCGCGVARDAAAAALPGMPCARPCTVPAPCRPRSAPEHFRAPSPCAVLPTPAALSSVMVLPVSVFTKICIPPGSAARPGRGGCPRCSGSWP